MTGRCCFVFFAFLLLLFHVSFVLLSLFLLFDSRMQRQKGVLPDFCCCCCSVRCCCCCDNASRNNSIERKGLCAVSLYPCAIVLDSNLAANFREEKPFTCHSVTCCFFNRKLLIE